MAVTTLGLGGPPASGETVPTALSSHSSTTTVDIGRSYETRYGSGPVSINEADGGPADRYPWSADPVTGLAGTITDVDVTLYGFRHERPRDVDILLSDGTTGVVLASDVGGTAPINDVNLRFDDDAADTLSAVVPFGSGTYRPSQDGVGDPFPRWTGTVKDTLSAFDGKDGNRGWGLYIVDDSFDFFGSVDSWQVEVTTTGVTPYPSTLTVSGAPGKITDLDVSLDGFTHARPGDVDVLLVGPNGQQATVLSDLPTNTAVREVGLRLDDDAPASLPDPLAAGTYRPDNTDLVGDPFDLPAPRATGSSRLSIFDGTDPAGTWRLFLADDTGGLKGELDGWSLHLSTSGSDSTGPRVTSTIPAAGRTGVGRAVTLRATISEAVQSGTVTTANAFVVRSGTTTRLPATVTYAPDTRTVIINPSSDLAARTTYKATLTTGVLDQAGNPLDQNPTLAGQQPKTWSFTTGS